MRVIKSVEACQVSGGFALYNKATGYVGLTEPDDSFVLMTDADGSNGFVYLRDNDIVWSYPFIDEVVQSGSVYNIYNP